MDEYMDYEDKENDEVESIILDKIYTLDDKLQDDLDLITLVEGNPRLYNKGRSEYKNIQDKDMAWESIGKCLTKPMNGPDAKHRWETLRNLYGRARRQLIDLANESNLSGSGQSDIKIEDTLSPQSKAIHRFLGKLYVPRKTTSNYKRPIMQRSCPLPSSKSSSASSFVLPNESLSMQTEASILRIQEKTKTQTISQLESVDPFVETPGTSTGSNLSLWNKDVHAIINKNESTSEADDSISRSKAKQPLKVPTTDIRKRKKTDNDTEAVLRESSKAISAMCCELPKLLQSPSVNKVTQDATEEEKAMATVLLHSFKQVPRNKRSHCMMKLFEILQSYEENTS